jgi:hypothetical protein
MSERIKEIMVHKYFKMRLLIVYSNITERKKCRNNKRWGGFIFE